MRTFLLAQQRLRNQAIQNDNQLNPIGVSDPLGTRTIATKIMNPHNYTQQQLNYINVWFKYCRCR